MENIEKLLENIAFGNIGLFTSTEKIGELSSETNYETDSIIIIKDLKYLISKKYYKLRYSGMRKSFFEECCALYL